MKTKMPTLSEATRVVYKRRKNGTKRSHAEWAETNNFTWYSEDTLPDSWRNDDL